MAPLLAGSIFSGSGAFSVAVDDSSIVLGSTRCFRFLGFRGFGLGTSAAGGATEEIVVSGIADGVTSTDRSERRRTGLVST